MKTSVAVSLLLLWSVGMFAQGREPSKKASAVSANTATKPSLRPATVSGYVFALTKGGDIKPARIAKVYMFYSRPAGKPVAQSAEQSPNTAFAADVFENEVVKGKEGAKVWQEDKPHLQESTICNSTLVEGYFGAINKTIHWGAEHMSQLVFGETDEDGKFEITIPPPGLDDASFEPGAPHDQTVFSPGVYLVAVYGTAGYNNAFWETEVTVEPGNTARIKMSSPTMACLKMENQ
jgi:hypothetical protein